MASCGMYTCKKCGWYNVVFGILFLLTVFWSGAPSWFSAWLIVGLYVLIWGITSLGGKEH